VTDRLPPSADEPLPGLGQPAASATPLQVQVDRSLAYMADQGLVDVRHAGVMELCRTLAASIRPGEKAYGVAQCAAQLLACFEKLLPDQEGVEGDGFSELRAYLAGVDASGRGTTSRDSS